MSRAMAGSSSSADGPTTGGPPPGSREQGRSPMRLRRRDRRDAPLTMPTAGKPLLPADPAGLLSAGGSRTDGGRRPAAARAGPAGADRGLEPGRVARPARCRLSRWRPPRRPGGGHGRRHRHDLADRRRPEGADRQHSRPAADLRPGPHPADRAGARHRQHAAVPAAVPGGQPGPVHPVRADRADRQAAGGPAGRRSGGAAPAGGRASRARPLLPRGDLAVGRHLRGLDHRPGGAARARARHRLPAAHHRGDGGRGGRGTAASVVWFIRMLRRSGLRVRFGQA